MDGVPTLRNFSSQLSELGTPSTNFRVIFRSMPNPNPLAGVVPQVVHPVNDGETTIPQYVEKIEGEVALYAYFKAQKSAPEIVKRMWIY